MSSPYDQHFTDSHSVTDQAFHGTARTFSEKILEKGFNPSDGDNLYLGSGVYFFDRQPSEAEVWAKQRHPAAWTVLRSTVRFGRCLNLHEKIHSDILTRLVSGMRLRLGNREIPESLAIKALAQHVQIDTVIGINQKHWDKPWHGARFEGGVQLILCVRTLTKITQTTIHCTGP